MTSTSDGRKVKVGEVIAVLGGATLLVASWVVVTAADRLPQWEANVFQAVNELPDWLWPLLWTPMQVGSYVGSLVVVALTALISRDLRLTLAALVASQLAFWLSKAVKGSVLRGRPASLLPEVHLREDAHGLGYVSGHAAVAFALAAVLAPSLPRRWQIVTGVVAVTVAFARVYAGAHLPLDVVGGAGLGLLVGTLSRWAFGLGGEGLPVEHPDAVESAERAT
jgi:glycosyltransferase 2 family protein